MAGGVFRRKKMKKIRIGIVDDNKDFCEVVSENLSAQENIEVFYLPLMTGWRLLRN